MRTSRWTCADLSRQDMQEYRRRLSSFVALPEGTEGCVVKASAAGGWRDSLFTGRLLAHSAIFVANDLDDCFEVQREAMRAAKFSLTSRVDVPVGERKKILALQDASRKMLRDWGDGVAAGPV